MINFDACVKYDQSTGGNFRASVEYECNWCIQHNLTRCPDYFEQFLMQNGLATEPVSLSELLQLLDAI